MAKKKKGAKTQNEQILANQKLILKKLGVLDELKKEVEEELEENQLLEAEDQEEYAQLKKLENMEKQLKTELKVKPMQKITYRDFSKSVIGALFGILGHFSFFYGVEIAKSISIIRATILYVVAFVIGATFLYLTGYRQLDTKESKSIAPMRLLIIYSTSIVLVIAVLYLFDFIGVHTSFLEIYKSVATISILAVMGAATADLIGKPS
jgi:uncharacterized membrane protein